MDLNLLNDKLVNKNSLSKIIYFEKLDSTNVYAKQNNLDDNTLVITSYQANGIGRFNRLWKSTPHDNLTFSLIKYFRLGIEEIHFVNFYSSYILCNMLKFEISHYKNIEISLKWPNDILLNGKKIAGILLDVSHLKKDYKKFIIGIGINVNQKDFSSDIMHKATSLSNEIDFEISLEQLLIRFIENFYSRLNFIDSKEELMKLWILDSHIKGKKVNFKKVEDDTEQEAVIMNLDNDGGLQMKFNNGNISKFYSGEINFIS